MKHCIYIIRQIRKLTLEMTHNFIHKIIRPILTGSLLLLFACNNSIGIRADIVDNHVKFTINNPVNEDIDAVIIKYKAYNNAGKNYYNGEIRCIRVTSENKWSETWSDDFYFTATPATIKITSVTNDHRKSINYQLVFNNFIKNN